jgi:two-component system response regulator YesN
MIRSIHENIGNPELSLTWLAKEVFFMNEEYLGRVFSKKADIKFSQYVFQVRMEMAKELIRRANELKVYEISKIVGFEDSQYFSKLFKKYTGFKPSEYKQSLGRNIP